MSVNPWLHRKRAIDRIRVRLEREHYPRLQMGWIVTLTGFAGLAASFLLLQAGVHAMGLRYFYAMCVAYLSFLLLLWGWLRLRGDAFDVPPFDGPGQPAPALDAIGAGGSFDGGGASGNYELPDAAPVLDKALALADESDGVGDAIGAVGEAGEALPLAVLLLVLGIVFSSFFVIYSAPVLFAELLVDGVLTASLYRRLRGLDRQHWLESALQRTFWPFVMTAVVVTVAGWGMGLYAPDAHSLGEVLRYSTEQQNPDPA